MGFLKIRRSLDVAGGSVHIGADTNLYRTSANILKTDDALTVTGLTTMTAGFVTARGGTVTAGTVDLATGTALVIPHHTASPTVNKNGHLTFLQKANRSYLLYQAGGTPCYMTLPQVTEGTILVTVGGTP